MSDSRRKNTNWQINKDSNGVPHVTYAQLAVLMDIRDELQRLNDFLYMQPGDSNVLEFVKRKIGPQADTQET